jgi:Ca2+-binding EF-hand superfamily protein
MPMQATAIARERLSGVFESFDADNDGQITEKDLDKLVADTAARVSKSADSTDAKGFRKGLGQFYGQVMQKLGKAPGSGITATEYAGVITKFSAPEMKSMINSFVDPLFALLDSDGDGTINEAEFKNLHLAQGLSESDIGGVFELVDADHNGTISLAELRQYIYDFYLSNDPSDAVSHVGV